jgi:hypothetical protein
MRRSGRRRDHTERPAAPLELDGEGLVVGSQFPTHLRALGGVELAEESLGCAPRRAGLGEEPRRASTAMVVGAHVTATTKRYEIVERVIA